MLRTSSQLLGAVPLRARIRSTCLCFSSQPSPQMRPSQVPSLKAFSVVKHSKSSFSSPSSKGQPLRVPHTCLRQLYADLTRS